MDARLVARAAHAAHPRAQPPSMSPQTSPRAAQANSNGIFRFGEDAGAGNVVNYVGVQCQVTDQFAAALAREARQASSA